MRPLEFFASLEGAERAAAIDSYVALLTRPALGAFEPHLSRRRNRVRDDLAEHVYEYEYLRASAKAAA